MSKRQPAFPFRVMPHEYPALLEFERLRATLWLADLREARVFRLSPTLWRFRTDCGSLDIVTAYPDRLTWDDFYGDDIAAPTKLPRRMTRAAIRNTAGARFV